MQIKKKLIMTSWRRYEHSYNTHRGAVVNRSKFDACISSSLKELKQTHKQTELRFIYWILLFYYGIYYQKSDVKYLH